MKVRALPYGHSSALSPNSQKCTVTGTRRNSCHRTADDGPLPLQRIVGRITASPTRQETTHAVISRFLGIAIAILYRDHEPAHFHATYAEFEITVDIHDGLVSGRFPPRAHAHVLEWTELHRDELLLLLNWNRARDR